MDPRYFSDYLRDYKRSGGQLPGTAMLVCHDDGQLEPPITSDTAMGIEPGAPLAPPPRRASTASFERPSQAALRPSLENAPLRLVFPIAKRPGTSFDYISVGRTPNMDVVLPLAHISKFHAYFTRDSSGKFTLADAGSKNGTWLGMRRLPVRSPEPLHDGDRIRIGASAFTFVSPEGFAELLKKHAVRWVEPAQRSDPRSST
jgi:hypothetical protein